MDINLEMETFSELPSWRQGIFPKNSELSNTCWLYHNSWIPLPGFANPHLLEKLWWQPSENCSTEGNRQFSKRQLKFTKEYFIINLNTSSFNSSSGSSKWTTTKNLPCLSQSDSSFGTYSYKLNENTNYRVHTLFQKQNSRTFPRLRNVYSRTHMQMKYSNFFQLLDFDLLPKTFKKTFNYRVNKIPGFSRASCHFQWLCSPKVQVLSRISRTWVWTLNQLAMQTFFQNWNS